MSAQRKSERHGMLAKIHVAKKQLRMADDDYRAVLMRVTWKSSAADCSDAELVAVLEEMQSLGFVDQPRPKNRRSDNPQVRMIYAIWADIRPLLDGNAGDAELRSFVARQTKSVKNPTGISAPEFLYAEEANKVIEGLKAWRARLQRKGEKVDA